MHPAVLMRISDFEIYVLLSVKHSAGTADSCDVGSALNRVGSIVVFLREIEVIDEHEEISKHFVIV